MEGVDGADVVETGPIAAAVDSDINRPPPATTTPSTDAPVGVNGSTHTHHHASDGKAGATTAPHMLTAADSPASAVAPPPHHQAAAAVPNGEANRLMVQTLMAVMHNADAEDQPLEEAVNALVGGSDTPLAAVPPPLLQQLCVAKVSTVFRTRGPAGLPSVGHCIRLLGWTLMKGGVDAVGTSRSTWDLCLSLMEAGASALASTTFLPMHHHETGEGRAWSQSIPAVMMGAHVDHLLPLLLPLATPTLLSSYLLAAALVRLHTVLAAERMVPTPAAAARVAKVLHTACSLPLDTPGRIMMVRAGLSTLCNLTLVPLYMQQAAVATTTVDSLHTAFLRGLTQLQGRGGREEHTAVTVLQVMDNVATSVGTLCCLAPGLRACFVPRRASRRAVERVVTREGEGAWVDGDHPHALHASGAALVDMKEEDVEDEAEMSPSDMVLQPYRMSMLDVVMACVVELQAVPRLPAVYRCLANCMTAVRGLCDHPTGRKRMVVRGYIPILLRMVDGVMVVPAMQPCIAQAVATLVSVLEVDAAPTALLDAGALGPLLALACTPAGTSASMTGGGDHAAAVQGMAGAGAAAATDSETEPPPAVPPEGGGTNPGGGGALDAASEALPPDIVTLDSQLHAATALVLLLEADTGNRACHTLVALRGVDAIMAACAVRVTTPATLALFVHALYLVAATPPMPVHAEVLLAAGAVPLLLHLAGRAMLATHARQQAVAAAAVAAALGGGDGHAAGQSARTSRSQRARSERGRRASARRASISGVVASALATDMQVGIPSGGRVPTPIALDTAVTAAASPGAGVRAGVEGDVLSGALQTLACITGAARSAAAATKAFIACGGIQLCCKVAAAGMSPSSQPGRGGKSGDDGGEVDAVGEGGEEGEDDDDPPLPALAAACLFNVCAEEDMDAVNAIVARFGGLPALAAACKLQPGNTELSNLSHRLTVAMKASEDEVATRAIVAGYHALQSAAVSGGGAGKDGSATGGTGGGMVRTSSRASLHDRSASMGGGGVNL